MCVQLLLFVFVLDLDLDLSMVCFISTSTRFTILNYTQRKFTSITSLLVLGQVKVKFGKAEAEAKGKVIITIIY